MDEMLTIAEAMRMIHASKSALYHARKHGRVRPVKAGRHLRIRRSDVDKYINAGKESPNGTV